MESETTTRPGDDQAAALASTRAAVWQHVLVRNKVLNESQWARCLTAFKKHGGELFVEQILLNEGWADQAMIENLRRAARMVVWGQLLVQSKLLSKEQWAKVVSVYNEQGGRGSVGQILVELSMLSEKQIQPARQRVAMVLGAPKLVVPAAKPAPKKPDPADDIEEIADIDDLEEIEETPKRPAAKKDDDDYGLSGEDDSEGPTKANEMDWVGTVDRETKHDFDESAIHENQIELVDLDEEVKIVVNNSMTTGKVDPNKLYVPGQALGKPAAAPTPAAIGETAPSGDERLPSPVPPGQLDPEAVKYIKKAVDVGASDVHLPAGSPPFMRLNGEITFFDAPPLSEEQALRMALGFMDDAQQQRFLRHHDLDLSYEHPELGRFRVNALLTFRGADIIFRIIPKGVPTLKSLGIPESIGGLTEWTQGLVLVTGPAGCGKSTTAAALVDMVNANRHDHVITVEDPVEFIHPSKNCNVTQRQVPRDTASFATALRGALREDPDVIMIGEMRDLETISLALTAAETGHLVIGTLHTKSAARTVDRIIDVFPTDQQAQIRIMISEALRGIVSQVLIPRANGKGRVAALEVLYNNTAVANAVRDAKSFQIPSIMQTGKKLGMKLMDDSLAELVTQGVIKREEAIKYAENPKHIPG